MTNRRLRTSLISSTIGILLYTCLMLVRTAWNTYKIDIKTNFDSRHVEKSFLEILVLSDRESFDNRERIRRTWAYGHGNVHFVVGKNYCAYPPENRLPHTCLPKSNYVSSDLIKSYLNEKDETTRRLQNETDVILVPTGDEMSEIQNKVTESYKWALNSSTFEWILLIEDTANIEITKLENRLKSIFIQSEIGIILSSLNHEQIKQLKTSRNKSVDLLQFNCVLNMLVTRAVAKDVINNGKHLVAYSPESNSLKLNLQNVKRKKLSETEILSGVMSTKSCKMLSILQIDSCFQDNITGKCLISKDKSVDNLYENPSIYLKSNRFDIVIKMVYAHFYSFIPEMPNVIEEAYAQHIKVWNGYNEYCKNIYKLWFDAHTNCTEKSGKQSFFDSFHKTIESIKEYGFNSEMSRIPVDVEGFVLNGAHRLAASVVLSKPVIFDHQKYKQHFEWGYNFFEKSGLSERLTDTIVLEWMKLQAKISSLKTHVSIVSVFSNDHQKDERMLKIVKTECSKDNGILYEKSVKLTRNGARQIITHMYGKQTWLEVKIEQMLKKFGSSSEVKILILFIYGKENEKLVACKNNIRKLYNDTYFKSTVHIPDNTEENLILAEMILNQNSLQFMNHAKDPYDCQRIATELAHRASLKPVSTLPGIYQGRNDIMIDSGAVLGFYGLRNRTDVDILFLKDIDRLMLGNKNGMNVQAHAFKSNSISKERPWGEDHFNQTGPIDQWDLFFDHEYHGYCYGIKFVSLQQMVRYKMKRNEPNKDQRDVSLIKILLERLK